MNQLSLLITIYNKVYLELVKTLQAQAYLCSLGWFFGFKLHLIYNEKGELTLF